jgi:hypothetical protein
MKKEYLTHNVCLECGRKWDEYLPFEERPHGNKMFGICEKCKEEKK